MGGSLTGFVGGSRRSEQRKSSPKREKNKMGEGKAKLLEFCGLCKSKATSLLSFVSLTVGQRTV